MDKRQSLTKDDFVFISCAGSAINASIYTTGTKTDQVLGGGGGCVRSCRRKRSGPRRLVQIMHHLWSIACGYIYDLSSVRCKGDDEVFNHIHY